MYYLLTGWYYCGIRNKLEECPGHNAVHPRGEAIYMIHFPFNERKTAQAAAHLLNFCGGELPYISLIKMLYLADRRTLVEIGQPITGARPVSMPYGPVLSEVLTLIDMGKEPNPPTKGAGDAWFELISPPSNYMVRAQSGHPDDNELSDYELEVLKEVADIYGKIDKWDLVKLTHGLPEWENPYGSVRAIDPRTILQSAGKPDDAIERIAAEAESLLFLSQLR